MARTVPAQSVHETYLTVYEIARICHVGEETVRRWIREGRVPSAQIGRRRLVRRSDLDSLLDSHFSKGDLR